MSDIKIQPSATGTATVTLTAPVSNTARTITLPDSTGTILDSVSTLDATKLSGNLPALSAANLTSIPAGNLTGTVADARISALTASKLTGALPAISAASLTGLTSAQMPAGSVVQYGTHHNGDYLNLDTTAWVDTGVSLSFTPLLSSSKLICTGIWSISAYSTSTYHGEVLYKIQVNGVDIHQEQDVYSPFPSNRFTVQLPQMAVYTNSDTNAKTIKLVIKYPDSGHTVKFNQYTGYSSLLVMEVAA